MHSRSTPIPNVAAKSHSTAKVSTMRVCSGSSPQTLKRSAPRALAASKTGASDAESKASESVTNSIS